MACLAPALRDRPSHPDSPPAGPSLDAPAAGFHCTGIVVVHPMDGLGGEEGEGGGGAAHGSCDLDKFGCSPNHDTTQGKRIHRKEEAVPPPIAKKYSTPPATRPSPPQRCPRTAFSPHPRPRLYSRSIGTPPTGGVGRGCLAPPAPPPPSCAFGSNHAEALWPQIGPLRTRMERLLPQRTGPQVVAGWGVRPNIPLVRINAECHRVAEERGSRARGEARPVPGRKGGGGGAQPPPLLGSGTPRYTVSRRGGKAGGLIGQVGVSHP